MNTQREVSYYRFHDAGIKALHLTFPPNKLCIRSHWHERAEMLYIQSGGVRLEVGTDIFEASAGEVVYIPPNTPHRGTTGDNTVRYDVLMLDIRSFYNETNVCRRMFSMLYDKKLTIPYVSRDETVIRCVNALCHELDPNSLDAAAMTYRLLSEICKTGVLSPQYKPKSDVVTAIAIYIESHFDQDVDMPDLCREFGYTAAHLCRKFKTTIGLTPMTYLKIYRLERSRELIAGTDRSISEIARQCGYADANYFTRCFTEHFGAPPTHYRKKPILIY